MPNLVAFRRVDEKLTCGEEGGGSGGNFYRPSLPSTHTHEYSARRKGYKEIWLKSVVLLYS